MLGELGLGTTEPMVTLPGPCGHLPNQDVPPEPLDGSPRRPSESLPTIPGPFPKLLPHEDGYGFFYLGWARQAIGGEPRVIGNLESYLSGRESLLAPLDSATYLPSALQVSYRLSSLPGTHVTHSQGPPPPAPPEPEPRAGAREPCSAYLSVSPAPRSWGPCGWSAFSPGRSAAWFLAGAGPASESTEGGSAAPRQVRAGSGSLA